MRILSFIFIVFLTISASAQTSEIKQTFDEATAKANAKDFEKALPIYRKLAGISQNEPKEFRAKIHFNIGVCLYQSKNPLKAVAEYERAVLLNPHYERAFYALGMAHFELKNFSEAEKAFVKSLEINRKNGETWFDLAFVYLKQENFDAAEIAFQNAIKFDSIAAADAHNNLGVISALRHDFETAEKQFKLAVGKSAEAEKNLQFCKYYKESDFKELIAKLEFSK
ncbi:MAG: tetratricopeptide repeat protein [Pyrinomonadaceae bacterium]|nr:tetratricopeptide repeat protein [Pyrinomonadaceae bacterium]